MSVTPFDIDLGRHQGRLAVADADQGIAFVLGDTLGRVFDMADGDFVGISQSVDMSGIDLIRLTPTFTTPGDLPAGARWRFGLFVDDVEVAWVYGWPGVERAPADLAAPVADLEGEHTLELRLTLEVD